MTMPRRDSSAMGERLTWCRKARPRPVSVQGRTVAAAAQKAVLWCLTDHSNADGSCYLKQDTIAAEACLTRQSVNAAVAALADQGLISVSHDPEARRTRVYWLNLSRLATDAPAAPVAGGDVSPDLQSFDDLSPQESDLSHLATDHSGPSVAGRDTDLSQDATPYKNPSSEALALASASAEGKSASKTTNQILASILLDASSTAQHFLSRLVEIDERWEEITPGALIKLGRVYGAPAVVEALGYMREESRGGIDPYPYLESVCVRIENEIRVVVSA